VNLQVIADSSSQCGSRDVDPLLGEAIQRFDFQKLTAAFDAARAANPELGSWSMAPALPGVRVGASDTVVIGGILAREYSAAGSLDDVDPRAAFALLARPDFGHEPQPFAYTPPGRSAPEPGAVNDPGYPHASDREPLPRLVSGLRERALDEWTENLENAIERWLERTGSNDGALSTANDPEKRSAVELELAAAWQRTRALLDRHLHYDRGAHESDAEGAVFMPSLATFGGGPFKDDHLGRVSGHYLQSLNGLEEGLKALAA
jgi:hypothetical protein